MTIEDCLKHTENRFELVLKSAERARRLELGEADPLVAVDNDKPTVIALREIAMGHDISPQVIDEVEQAEKALFADPSEYISHAGSKNPLSSVQVPPTGSNNFGIVSSSGDTSIPSDPLSGLGNAKGEEDNKSN